MSAAQNPPPEIRNKNILKRRIGDRRFKIKKIMPQLKNM